VGAVNNLTRLAADKQNPQAPTGLTPARPAPLADTAALYAALGGGWQDGESIAKKEQ
jgi:hypothetical protein